ncbi:Heterogeneous nuclear ribonucleoprotein 27C [Nymphon striatum]|nr:Heterogeneous nuclear ribonucleoprotein 27C [Nymphon striatum]
MTYETTELEILFGYRKKLKPDAVPTIKTVLSEQTGVPKTRENKDFEPLSVNFALILHSSESKIFVGGLSWETDRDSLSNHFSKYGEVVDCVVMKDNGTGKSRGFGFVTFKEPSVVQNILRDTHLLDGRTIDPKPCNPRSVQLQKKASNFKIFLGGLPLDITETDLKNFFGNYGHVTEVTIMYDQEAKRCRGFGFLSFDSEQSVKKACHDHFVHIKGKQPIKRRNDLIIRNSEDLLERRYLNETIHNKRQRTETRAYNQQILESTIREGKGYKTAKKRLAIVKYRKLMYLMCSETLLRKHIGNKNSRKVQEVDKGGFGQTILKAGLDSHCTNVKDRNRLRVMSLGFKWFHALRECLCSHLIETTICNKTAVVECKLAQVKQTNSGFSMMNSNQNMYMSSSNVAGNWNMNGQISNNGIGNSYQSWGNQTVGSYQGGYQNWNGGYSVQQQYGAPQSYESGHESAHVVYIDSSTVVLRDMIAYFWKLPPLECQKFSLPRQQEKFLVIFSDRLLASYTSSRPWGGQVTKVDSQKKIEMAVLGRQNCNGMANYYGNYMQQSPADVSQTNQGYQTMAGAPQDVGQSQVGGQGGGTHNAQNTGDSNQADCQNSGYQPYSSQSTGPTGVSDQEIGRDGQNTGYHPYRR